MSDSVQPHRWQPTRLPHPWASPGNNTGVDCHFLLQCMKVKSQSEVAQSYPTLSDLMDCSLPGSSVHGILQARALEWGAIAFSGHENEFFLIFFFFSACGVLVPRPGIEPTTPAVEAWSLTLGHQGSPFLKFYILYFLLALPWSWPRCTHS